MALAAENERAPTTLRLAGWRQFDDVAIDFHSRLTVITGANGAGKTTILNILAVNLGWSVPFASVPAPARATVEFMANVWRAITERYYGTPTAPTVAVGAVGYPSGREVQILVPLSPSGHRFEITYDMPVQVSGLYIPSHRPVYVPVEVRKPRRPIDFAAAHETYAAAVRSAWTDIEPTTSSPIRLLKETLLSWSDGLSGAFRGFSATLQSVLPSELGFDHLEERRNDIVLVCSTGDFTLDSVSGGIAAIIDMTWQIFLYSNLEDAHDGFMVLIDEPENHLHPEMQRSVLFKLTEYFTRAQFIVASHAPLVVTSVRDAAVYALAYADRTDEQSARRVVHCVQLKDFERAGTASDVLRQVLGLDYTMPIWAAKILETAITDVSKREFDRDALADMKKTLEDNSLNQYIPNALAKISGVEANDGGSPARA